jgi:hypothetical protein
LLIQLTQKNFEKLTDEKTRAYYGETLPNPYLRVFPIKEVSDIGRKHLKKKRLEAMCNWKKKDVKGIKKNSYIKEIQRKNNKILKISEKNELEKLEVSTDRFPLLKMRKSIRKFFILTNMMANAVITTSLFENLSIFVILVNSGVMMVDDPNKTDDEKSPFFAQVDHVFNVLYTIEMVMKIVGMGLFWAEDSYLREGWNILDFVIVISSLLPYFSAGSDSDTVIR